MAQHPNDNDSRDRSAILLVIFSLVSVAIGYFTSILVARLLGPDGFEDYAVAIASLALMSTLAEAGTGKYALQLLPAYVASDRWSLASGYWRFSLRVVLLVSVAIAAVVAASEGLEDAEFGDYPLGIAVLFLPAVALAGAGIDFVMASQAAVRGSAIGRLVMPSTTLALLWFASSVVDGFNSSWAVGCYGAGGVIGALLAVFVYRRASPREVFSASPTYERKTWIGQCVTFLTLALLVTWTFRISVIVLEMLPVAESEVAWFAAALETGCLILLMSKSTDKFFQPHVSVMIERESWEDGAAMRRRRWIWIGSACALFLLVIFFLGKSILGLYGETFVAGYPALCLVAVATTAWTMFSLAPAFLKFSGHDRFVLGVSAAGAIAMAGATAVFGYHWGATGAGIAFCIVLCSVVLTFLISASRQFAAARRSAGE